MSLEAHIIEPLSEHRASVIWLHGLGADGYDFASVAEQLDVAETFGLKFIFPHAPMRPITINGGYPMRGWYDIVSLGRDNFVHDLPGIEASCAFVQNLVEQEHAKGIAYHRILLAGFSQGGAIALFAGLSMSHPLAGILALSTYVPAPETLMARCDMKARNILMMHGTSDELIPLETAEASVEWLRKMHQEPVFRKYSMGHGLCQDEILDIGAWVRGVLK